VGSLIIAKMLLLLYMPKIIIVEDDFAISQMYRLKFESEGYNVDTADNGKLGLTLIEKTMPDMVLLDLMMPEMNGDEMLRHLRKTPWGKNIKVIILTNMGEHEVPKDVFKLGVESVVLKADMTPRQVAELVKSKLN
jgi:DNA-binding response OmpR family regulator